MLPPISVFLVLSCEVMKFLTVLFCSFKNEHDRGLVVGLNHHSGEPIDPQMEGIFDNYSVKRQIINSGYVMQQSVFVTICFHNLCLLYTPSVVAAS
jgi:hypothetical protein